MKQAEFELAEMLVSKGTDLSQSPYEGSLSSRRPVELGAGRWKETGCHVIFSIIMDANTTNPPIRLQANSSVFVSSRSTERHLQNFLNEFESRSVLGQSGNTAVTVQLRKLKDAISEENAQKRLKGKAEWYGS